MRSGFSSWILHKAYIAWGEGMKRNIKGQAHETNCAVEWCYQCCSAICTGLQALHTSAILFVGSIHEECRLLGYKTPVRTSQETHYVSATESSQLMLCKIWGFHGSDYEECLLGYKNPVRTSQETFYVSATESSRLMLCKIWGSHGDDYEGYPLQVCDAMWLL
jgi:hypothetical protein